MTTGVEALHQRIATLEQEQSADAERYQRWEERAKAEFEEALAQERERVKELVAQALVDKAACHEALVWAKVTAPDQPPVSPHVAHVVTSFQDVSGLLGTSQRELHQALDKVEDLEVQSPPTLVKAVGSALRAWDETDGSARADAAAPLIQAMVDLHSAYAAAKEGKATPRSHELLNPTDLDPDFEVVLSTLESLGALAEHEGQVHYDVPRARQALGRIGLAVQGAPRLQPIETAPGGMAPARLESLRTLHAERGADQDGEVGELLQHVAALEAELATARNPRCQRQECARERAARDAGDVRVKELTAQLAGARDASLEEAARAAFDGTCGTCHLPIRWVDDAGEQRDGDWAHVTPSSCMGKPSGSPLASERIRARKSQPAPAPAQGCWAKSGTGTVLHYFTSERSVCGRGAQSGGWVPGMLHGGVCERCLRGAPIAPEPATHPTRPALAQRVTERIGMPTLAAADTRTRALHRSLFDASEAGMDVHAAIVELNALESTPTPAELVDAVGPVMEFLRDFRCFAGPWVEFIKVDPKTRNILCGEQGAKALAAFDAAKGGGR